ncbi:MAG: hypothetical protein WBO10_00800 [Pyrinomonadaceae bacterium]
MENFDVEFRTDHVHVELAPEYEITAENQDEFWRRIKLFCDEHGSRRVLVEGYAPKGERKTAEIIDHGMRTATVPNLWLAFSLVDFTPSDRSELFEAIAATCGVRVRFFSDREIALRWLRSNAPA